MTVPSGSDWPSENLGLSILAAGSAALAGLLIVTYFQYVLLAIVLAYLAMPAQRRLEREMRPFSAAVTIITVAVLAVFVPLAYVLTVAVQQGLRLIRSVLDGELGAEAVPDEVGLFGYVLDIDVLYATYQDPIAMGLRRLATNAVGVLRGLPDLLIGLSVTFFVLFALLRDGDDLLSWTRSVVPVSDAVYDELVAELDDLMWASVVGNVIVAAIQAVGLGAALFVAEVPGVVFLTVATFVLTLLPLVGAFGVWVPVSVYLFAVGRPATALLLVAFGSVVSVSDAYLRPAVINRTGAINIAIIVVGIFGGIVFLGAIGLFLGPVILGGAKVVLDIYAGERADSSDRDAAAVEGPSPAEERGRSPGAADASVGPDAPGDGGVDDGPEEEDESAEVKPEEKE